MTTPTVEAPPAAPAEPAPQAELQPEAISGPQRWDFPHRDEPDEQASEPARQDAQTGDTPEPKAEEQAPPPQGDEDAEYQRFVERFKARLEKDPDFEKRVDQLANNRVGNKLQQERAQWESQREAERKAQEEWNQASEQFTKLQDDPSYRVEMVRQHGEIAVHQFEEDYRAAARERQAEPQIAAYRSEFTKSFNDAALSEFKATVGATLTDMPEEVRASIEKLAYDPAGNWLADGFEAIAKGFKEVLEKRDRDHARALDEAREAGKNEAFANREESRPLNVEGAQAGSSDEDILRRYGDPTDNTVTREQYRAAAQRLGRDWLLQ